VIEMSEAESEEQAAYDEYIEAQKKMPYFKNMDTARRIGLEFFGGAQLRGFGGPRGGGIEADWSFQYPRYIYGSDNFAVSDWAMGFIAERMGLPWVWAYRDQPIEHPMKMLNNYLDNEEKRKHRDEEMMVHMSEVMWMTGPEEDEEPAIQRCFYCAKFLEDGHCPDCGRTFGQWAHFDGDVNTHITAMSTGSEKVHLYEDCTSLQQSVKRGKKWHYLPGVIYKPNVCQRCLNRWEKENEGK
jgi:hypothetical protein